MQFVYDVKLLHLKNRNHYIGIKQNRSNEDNIALARSGDCYYYAAFDGHGGGNSQGANLDGTHVVLYLKDYLHHHVFKHLEGISYNSKTEIERAIIDAFCEVDEYLFKNGGTAGSTAAVLLITPVSLITINLGDSRVLILSDSEKRLPSLHAKNDSINFSKSNEVKSTGDLQVVFLSAPHTAIREENRVRDAGGFIEMGRVNGIYAPSRSFGDYDCKFVNGAYSANAPMSCVPEVQFHNKEASFAIVGTDGLFDVYEYKLDLLLKTLESVTRISEAPGKLLDYAMERNKDDDTTCIIVTL